MPPYNIINVRSVFIPDSYKKVTSHYNADVPACVQRTGRRRQVGIVELFICLTYHHSHKTTIEGTITIRVTILV